MYRTDFDKPKCCWRTKQLLRCSTYSTSPSVMEPEKIYKSPPLSQTNPATPTNSVSFNIYYNVTYHLLLGLPVYLFPFGKSTKFLLCVLMSSRAYCMRHSSHLQLVYPYMWCRVPYKVLLTVQFLFIPQA